MPEPLKENHVELRCQLCGTTARIPYPKRQWCNAREEVLASIRQIGWNVAGNEPFCGQCKRHLVHLGDGHFSLHLSAAAIADILRGSDHTDESPP